MELAWTGTDPTSGRVSFAEHRSDQGGFRSWLNILLTTGTGYTEVRRSDADFPLLTFSFKDGYGVVHLFESQEECRLLRGDDVLPSTGTIDVPVHDQESAFSGAYVSTLARAVATVIAFIEGTPVDGLGDSDRL